ncbi:MAG: ABC transporter permease subunit [Myxococcales bacterium]|nr:ABC transporter permease subunit [Myxococcales bacterium]
MRSTLTIAKREFRSYFDAPLAYIVICLSLVMLGFAVFLVGDLTFFKVNRADLTNMFKWTARGLAWLIVPVITMRLVAEEKRSGTLEMLITLPVRDREVILGKFLGAWSLVLVLIAASALYPIMMFVFPWKLGALDWRPVLSGYLGLVVHSTAAVALGLLISSITESQMIALLVTVSLLFLLHLFGGDLSVDWLPEGAQRAASLISFDGRLESFRKGMINTHDVVYFLSIGGGCLIGAFFALERRKWA